MRLQGIYFAFISSLLQGCGLQGALLAYGATLVAAGQLAGERLIAVMLYQSQLMDQFSAVLNTFSSLYKTSGAAAKARARGGCVRCCHAQQADAAMLGLQVFELLDHAPPRRSPAAATPAPPPAVGHVTFAEVHFAAPSRPGLPVLRGVTLAAPPGRTLALVGASGAGKSTLFHLLEAFYPPSRGRVCLDGVDARAAPPAWLHAAIGAFSRHFCSECFPC